MRSMVPRLGITGLVDDAKEYSSYNGLVQPCPATPAYATPARQKGSQASKTESPGQLLLAV